ncbi:UDP-N-acetyl-D-glucosamine dehydrogenase [Calderihabitans maritimus]|uniref:UDP-N-acetyl-D-glucosamine dehydrogenase n=1 Tax=Calderihabitans maritimus TaxID=1246530 RepID=A0A1Z5HVD5_9FIRM|nr:UDP-N-acetyl-D-glucosamine dehydrogenase [Calderihabitans maritimus]
MADVLKDKIKLRLARVAVIGLGYVGLPLAVQKAKIGFDVLGIDQNPKRVDLVNQGKSYINDVAEEVLQEVICANKLQATESFHQLGECDIVIICVPTPLTPTRDPDISYIERVTLEVSKYLHRGQLVTLESTTYPGTTEEVVLPLLERSGLEVGKDYFLAYSPERVDPGNKRYNTQNTSKIVGGVTSLCLEVACTFYAQTIQQVVPVSSPSVAEMTKIFENTYRAVNIALVNELMFLCDRMGIDVWEVVEAAATKPFGIQTFYPGPGVGGHCIPVDPFYLTWKARQYDFSTRFIELAGQINIQATYYVVEKVRKVLNLMEKSVNGARILVLGVTYKKDVPDIRESPALKIMKLLQEERAELRYHDPYIPEVELPGTGILRSVPLEADQLAWADCVVIITDHTIIDYQFVVDHARIVVDTRNATRQVTLNRDRIVKI